MSWDDAPGPEAIPGEWVAPKPGGTGQTFGGMMDQNNQDTGGPAFPMLGNVAYNSDWQVDNGMTLLDYFAGQVLPYWLAGNWEIDEAAQKAYASARAMLQARKAGG